MPRKSKAQLFGVFDEQAISILTVLHRKDSRFSELGNETKLPKASLFRVLERLEHSGIVAKTADGYAQTRRGNRIVKLVSEIAREESWKTTVKVERRMNELKRAYSADHRIFHSDPRWERTAEKPLAEVMAVSGMTGVESLLFQQRFQEEVAREEQRLQLSTSKKQPSR